MPLCSLIHFIFFNCFSPNFGVYVLVNIDFFLLEKKVVSVCCHHKPIRFVLKFVRFAVFVQQLLCQFLYPVVIICVEQQHYICDISTLFHYYLYAVNFYFILFDGTTHSHTRYNIKLASIGVRCGKQILCIVNLDVVVFVVVVVVFNILVDVWNVNQLVSILVRLCVCVC